MRIESDTLGAVAVPDDALYGAQTQRAVENFPVSGLREHPDFIRAFVILKKAAAFANRQLGALEPKLADAVAALENIRLSLLRLKAGTGTVGDLTADLTTARTLNAAMERTAEAAEEVERFLKPGRASRPLTPPEPHHA